jgi:hypothetical protein
MHDLQAVFQKLDSCHKPTGHPRPPTLENFGSAAECEDYRSKLRAMRPLAYTLLAFWIAVYAGIAVWAGWLP